MLHRKLFLKTFTPLVHRNVYEESRFQKLIFFIQKILNKVSNEDNRSFSEKMAEYENKNIPVKKQLPKNQLQAENRFTSEQQALSIYEKERLKRIDDILATKTYFHETKMYEQRIDSQNVIHLSQLYKKYKEQDRVQLDFLNPQMPKKRLMKKKRKMAKWVSNLKKYPTGNADLVNFEENHQKEKKGYNDELIKFLGQETLYTKLSLSELDMTIQSINKQKLLIEQQGALLDEEQQEINFIFNGQTYFKPNHSDSIYRINNTKYSKKLAKSIDSFIDTLTNKEGNIQEVISMDEIYECLKNYYFDERVNEYIAKIQNQQLDYFFTNLHVSPDGNDIFMVIDLLGTKKQYVGLYKHLGKQADERTQILQQNVIFNFKPEVAFQNNGQLYYIQRSPQGLYTQFTKTIFNFQGKNALNANPSQNENKNTQQLDDLIQKYRDQRNTQILYKCQPFQQLRILVNHEAKFSTQSYNVVSNNILLEEIDVGTKNNNKIYLILHSRKKVGGNAESRIKMQLITHNNDRLAKLFQRENVSKRFGHVQHWEINPHNLYTECFEIMEVGYLLIRYCLMGQMKSSYLKYGHSSKFTSYITLIPYSQTKINKNDYKQLESPKQTKPALQHIHNGKQVAELNEKDGYEVQLQIELPSEESVPMISSKLPTIQQYKLDYDHEHIIYVCPEQQFITDLQVKHSSISNVYLLINKSLESVYNRNSLYIYPLRKNIHPYSIYLDGFPIQIDNKNIGTGISGKLDLKVLAPLIPVNLEYILWKKQIKEKLNKRIYTETITIREEEQGGEITIKVVSNSNFIKRKKKAEDENQCVILYLPSKNQRLDQLQVQKVLEKGVIFVQIVKCRGIFGSNMIDLMRGSKQMYNNYIDDIRQTILFIKQNIGQHVGVYAEGPSSSFATLLLNIRENQFNQLFDCSILHEGIYDLSQIAPQTEYFFGSDPSIFSKVNPYKFPMFDQTKSEQNKQKSQNNTQYIIHNLQNIIFSTLSPQSRVQSRKFINKLRVHAKTIYQTVFLKQFDSIQQKDLYNFAYLYKIMHDSMTKQYKQALKQKHKERREIGQSASRDEKDKLRNQEDENI